MKKILIAVDGKKASQGILSLFKNLLWTPERTILLHVQQLEGNVLMTGMLGEAEMSTLKESLEGTEHKEKLDKHAEKILDHYRKELEKTGLKNIITVVRAGHPSEEIIKASLEEKADLVIVGCSGKSRVQRMMSGCVARDVEKNSQIPVLISKGDGCGEHSYMWEGNGAYATQ